MRLFKKFFSIGSRKSKKRSAADPYTEPLPATQERLLLSQTDDTEAAVCRLLRSSSGRFASEPQSCLNSLPPLPHPIDSVIPHPKSSSTTIASVSARSTYSVTIRSRTVHSRTEFPNAYPLMDINSTPQRSLADSVRRRSKSVPITPRDKSRLLVLRQDPSVASLLNHYDDQGHLDSALFSNTPSPSKEGALQRRRTGSTLRQLLGHPSSPEVKNSVTEGDISWAERFLGEARETDGNSSVSSIGPRTPVDTHFTHTHSTDDKVLPTECDTSATNHQTFSSLEVELSISTDPAHSQTLDSSHGNSITPQRASQVFGFLGEKKRIQDGLASKLPQLKTATPSYRRFSADSSISDTKHSHIPLPRRSNTHVPRPSSPVSQRRFSLASEAQRTSMGTFLPLHCEESTLPQPTAPQSTGQGSRGPRGPRRPSEMPSRHSTGPLLTSCDGSNSRFVTEQPQSTSREKLALARQRDMHSQIPKLRSASGSSSSSTESKRNFAIDSPRRRAIPSQSLAPAKLRSTTEADQDPAYYSKESDMPSRLPQPVTPIRPVAFHTLCSPSSPASSSELSPVAKQLMADLRQQRMCARQRDRQRGRLGSGQSRIRY